METLLERYKNKIAGVLTCIDRLVIIDTMPVLSNSKSMTSYLYENQIRIFDYAKFAEPYRNQLRENAQRLAEEGNFKIEHIQKSSIEEKNL